MGSQVRTVWAIPGTKQWLCPSCSESSCNIISALAAVIWFGMAHGMRGVVQVFHHDTPKVLLRVKNTYYVHHIWHSVGQPQDSPLSVHFGVLDDFEQPQQSVGKCC